MELLNDHLWLHIRREARISRQMWAAIAYVTDITAFALRDGDCLVVNASDGALAAGSTDPRVLRSILNAGVTLYSCSTLHAKAIAFDKCAIVGSMNASDSSRNRLIECALLTREVSLVSETRAFIERLIKDAATVDAAFIDRAMEIYVKPDLRSTLHAESAQQQKLWYLEKCPYTSAPNLRAYFIALLVAQIGDLKSGETFALWPNVKNMTQHEQRGRLEKRGTRYLLTPSGVDYFSADEEWPEPWRLTRFLHAITTGDSSHLPEDLRDRTMKPFYV